MQVNQGGLKLNGTHQLLVHADDNILGRSVYAIKKDTETLLVGSKESGLEVNADKVHGHVLRSECKTKLQYKD